VKDDCETKAVVVLDVNVMIALVKTTKTPIAVLIAAPTSVTMKLIIPCASLA
jgi:hypothetical protein